MIVVDHSLWYDAGTLPSANRASPNHGGELRDPKFIIVHYTAGRGFEQSIDWLCRTPKPKSKDKGSSAHAIIGRNGQLAQLVPLNVQAWHAGKSEYSFVDSQAVHRKLSDLNEHAIGFELDNYGLLYKRPTGYYTYFGRQLAAEDVVLARHKNAACDAEAWHAYTQDQFDMLYEVCEAVIDAYPSIIDVLGHDDVSPGRKFDPGPAFALGTLRAMLFGRGAG